MRQPTKTRQCIRLVFEVAHRRCRFANALHAGDQLFALLPSIHGHLPDRQFVVADYDGGRKTIVLDGPTAYEREIHDMDRLDPPKP